MEKSLVKKLRAWNVPGDMFVVLRDKDSDDCHALKDRLLEKCRAAGRSNSLVRIVCHELESWFLGDLDAVAEAFDMPAIRRSKNRRKFQNPDRLVKPSEEIKRLIPTYQKIGGARLIAPLLNLKANRGYCQMLCMSP